MPAPNLDFTGGPMSGSLDVRWIHGSPRASANTDPALQVHQYDRHTFILRQSKSTNYEGPFLYLLFGNERAVLFDSGATSDPAVLPLRDTVDRIVDEWLADHPRVGFRLVVAHTHAHGDHVAGDAQFADRPDTIVVPHDVADVREFFGFTHWPDEVRRFDLGGRVLDIAAIPGHHAAHIAAYDPWTGFLLTGDTVYRGRLYVEDPPVFVESLSRLVDLAGERVVTHVLGCHIEMTNRPRRDYPLGSTYQPDEPPLEMTVADLESVSEAAARVVDQPGPHFFDDFAIFVGPCRAEMLRQAARSVWWRLRSRFA
jgi:hydroxyacylglutathione hydrolase